MHKKVFNLILLICVISASGCIVTKIHTVPVQRFSAPYDAVWNSTLDYLNKEKEPIVASDKEKGLIATDWVIMEKVIGAKRYRYVIQLTKLGDNEIQVGISSPQEAYSMGDWEEILPTERRAHRIFRFIRSQVKKYTISKKTVLVTGNISERPFNKRQRGIVREK